MSAFIIGGESVDAQVWVAVVNAVVSIVTIIAGVITLWLKINSNKAEIKQAVDENTVITKEIHEAVKQ
jgi:hypothetical protein